MDPAANRLADSQSLESFPAVPQTGPQAAAAASVNVPSGSPAAKAQVATCGLPQQHPHFKQPSPPTSPAAAETRPAAPPAERKGRFAMEDYPDVVNPSKVLPTPSHDVVHFLQTSGPPITSKFRRLDGEKLTAARAEFLQLEKDGIVRRSKSPWASPLHMVRK